MNDKSSRQILAVMFIDIVDYSKKMSEDENETLKLLEKYKLTAVPIIKKYNGMIVKWLGDGLFCYFSSALDAVNCALSIHEKLYEYNQNPEGKFLINVRIGIHLGDVVKKDDDLFGDGVNVAARIESKAPVNGICITGTVYSAVSSHPQFSILPLGKVDLKNINFDHELYLIETGYEESLPKKHPVLSLAKKRLKQAGLIILFIITAAMLIKFSGGIWNDGNAASRNDTLKQKKEIKANENVSTQYINELIGQKGQKFYKEITQAATIDQINEYLNVQHNKGKLNAVERAFIDSEKDKFIILLKGKDLLTVLYCTEKYFIDLKNRSLVNNFDERIIGLRPVWVELLE